MAPLIFKKVLLGPSLDIFTKDFAHENEWVLQQGDKTVSTDFNNLLQLNKDGTITGSTTIKHNTKFCDSELKLQTNGVQILDLKALCPAYEPISLGLRGTYDLKKDAKKLNLYLEHINKLNTTSLQVAPLGGGFSLFSLFNLPVLQKNVTLGAEVASQQLALPQELTLAATLKDRLHSKDFHLGILLNGTREKFFNKASGFAYASCNSLDKPKSLCASFEHNFKDNDFKLSFGALWYLTCVEHPNAAFLKAKCDSAAKVAVAITQKFNPSVTGTFGFEVNAKNPLSNDLNYGMKINFT